MDHQALELRLARIEEHLAKLGEQLAKLDGKTVRAWEMHDVRTLKAEQQIESLDERLTGLRSLHAKLTEGASLDTVALEMRVLNIEARLQDVPALEKIAFAAYEKNHPEAQAAVREIDDAVETARCQIFFSNLPSVQEHRRQSKS